MKYLKKLLLPCVLFIGITILSTNVDAQNAQFTKPVKLLYPDVELPYTKVVAMVITRSKTRKEQISFKGESELLFLNPSYLENKSLQLRFKGVNSPPSLEAKTYITKSVHSRQAMNWKDVVNLSSYKSGVSEYTVHIETNNYIRGQPLEILVTFGDQTLRFFWWVSGGGPSRFLHNVCMQVRNRSYLFDEEREVWLSAHPQTIDQKQQMFNLVRRIKE